MNDPELTNNTTSFKKGLDYQREIYKRARAEFDYDLMCSAIENIKTEVKSKYESQCDLKRIKFIEKVIAWYYNKETKFRVKTQRGWEVRYPSNINQMILQHLNRAYQELIKILDVLEFL